MATTSVERAALQREPHRASGVLIALRGIYLVLALMFVSVVILQVFFAGATLLVNAQYLLDHRSLGEAIWPLPLLMIGLSLFARLPRRVVLLSVLLQILYVMQYAMIHVFPSLGLPMVFRAMHAVNALLLFWVSLVLAKSALRALRSNAQPATTNERV